MKKADKKDGLTKSKRYDKIISQYEVIVLLRGPLWFLRNMPESVWN